MHTCFTCLHLFPFWKTGWFKCKKSVESLFCYKKKCPILFPLFLNLFFNPIPSPVLKKRCGVSLPFVKNLEAECLYKECLQQQTEPGKAFCRASLTRQPAAQSLHLFSQVSLSRCAKLWGGRNLCFLEVHSGGNKRVKTILPNLLQPQPHGITIKSLSMFCAFFSFSKWVQEKKSVIQKDLIVGNICFYGLSLLMGCSLLMWHHLLSSANEVSWKCWRN